MIVHPALEYLGCRLAGHRAILQDVAQILREGRLARPEEPRYPDTHAFTEGPRRLCYCRKHAMVVIPDGSGHDVLAELLVDHHLVGLVHLDDLFNSP